jgi:hypothetical protein
MLKFEYFDKGFIIIIVVVMLWKYKFLDVQCRVYMECCLFYECAFVFVQGVPLVVVLLEFS